MWDWLYKHNKGFQSWVEAQNKHAVKVAAALYYKKQKKASTEEHTINIIDPNPQNQEG